MKKSEWAVVILLVILYGLYMVYGPFGKYDYSKAKPYGTPESFYPAFTTDGSR